MGERVQVIYYHRSQSRFAVNRRGCPTIDTFIRALRVSDADFKRILLRLYISEERDT